MGSYTTSELERHTGFGRRTIAYYVQEGLLPHVGRRGPRTRYPELVRDRLLFIRRVREAEAESEIRPVSLSSLRELFEALPGGLVASVAAGETPITPDIVSLSAIEQRSMVDRVAALRARLLDARPRPAAKSPFPGIHQEEGLELRAEAPPDLDEDWLQEPQAMEEPGAPYPAISRTEGPRSEDDLVADAVGLDDGPGQADEDADALAHQLSWVLNELRSHARRERAADAVDTWSQVEVTSDIRLSVRGMADEDAFLLRVAGRLLRQVLEGRSPLVEGSSDDLEE